MKLIRFFGDDTKEYIGVITKTNYRMLKYGEVYRIDNDDFNNDIKSFIKAST